MQQPQNAKKNSGGDPMTWLIGCLLGGAWVVVWATITKLAWPVIKWAFKKAWAAATKKGDQPANPGDFEEDVEDAPGNALRTPDIFKGAKNLAPMQEFKLH